MVPNKIMKSAKMYSLGWNNKNNSTISIEKRIYLKEIAIWKRTCVRGTCLMFVRTEFFKLSRFIIV